MKDTSGFLPLSKINEHSSTVTSLLLLQDGRLASSSSDKTIKVFDLSNDFHCDITLAGHTDRVYFLSQMDNGLLLSCSADHQIKVWSIFLFDYVCEYTIQDAHSDSIYKVIPITNKRIASCSKDQTIKIWSSDTFMLVKVLEGHTKDVRSILQINSREMLVSGSYEDGTLRFWDLETYQCQSVIKGVYCDTRNSLVQVDDERVLVGYDDKIYIIDINKYRIEREIEDYRVVNFSCFALMKKGTIVCGGNGRTLYLKEDDEEDSFHCDGVLCEFDIESGRFLYVQEKAHEDIILTLLKIGDDTIISGSEDTTMQIWKVH